MSYEIDEIRQPLCKQVLEMIAPGLTQNPSPLMSLETALRGELGQHSQTNWYALMDAAQLPDLARTIRRGTLRNIPYVSLFNVLYQASEDSEAANGDDAAPYLFSIGSGTSKDLAITYTVQKALETYSVSWLASPLTLSDLARRLALRTEAKLTENMEVLLRFYDSRILPNVLSVLAPEQATVFSSVAQGWWYADREGRLRSCACRFAQEDAFHAPLEFSQAQENKLAELAFPDAVLEQLQESQPDLMAPMTRAQQHAFVVRQIARVKELQLDSMPAILAYCVFALVEGEDYVERMPLKDKIAAITASDAPLEGITA